MMEDLEFVTFQRFTEKEQAEKLVSLLEKNDIETVTEDNSSSLGSSFGGSEFTNEFVVKLRKADFEKANRILIEDSVSDIDAIDKAYYLFSFTDQELLDILAHREEWSAFDFLLAQRLLKDRGLEIGQDELDLLKKQRIAELSQPEPPQTGTIVTGYIFAFMGGIFAVVIGWYLSAHKRTLPNGERVSQYREADRKHGKIIFYLGIFFVIFWMAIWFSLGAILKGFHHN